MRAHWKYTALMVTLTSIACGGQVDEGSEPIRDREQALLTFGPPPTLQPQIKAVAAQAGHLIGLYSFFSAQDPLPGASYYLKVTFQATANMPTPFQIQVTMPGNHVTTKTVHDLSSSSAYIHMDGLPIHEDISYEVHVDPENKAGESALQRMDNRISPTLSFSYPSQALQKFDTVTYDGWQQLGVIYYGSGTMNLTGAMIGVPDTSARQLIVSRAGQMAVFDGSLPTVYSYNPVSSAPHSVGIYFMDATSFVSGAATHLTFRSEFRVQVSNLRANPNLLNAVTWQQVDNASQNINYFKSWLASEGKLFDVQAQELGDFVTDVLGANHRSNYTPYEAARELFVATTNHISYQHPSPSHTTVDIINNGEADCGGYAALWITALRRIGIPARAVVANRSNYRHHVWGEFYLPGVGWVPGDPTDDADGEPHANPGVPYQLGTLMRNDFVVVSRGADNQYGGVKRGWLQGPNLFKSGSKPHIAGDDGDLAVVP